MKEYSLIPPSTAPQSKWQRFAERRLPNIVIFLMVTTLVAAVLFPYMAVNVTSGQVGVLWRRFGSFDIYCWCFVGRGTVLEPSELNEEGLHIIWPWNRLFLYDLRLQTRTHSYNAIAKDGVSLIASISVRFQLKHDSVPQVHKFIGPDYVDLVVLPEIGSRAREIIAKYNAEEVYSTSRQAIADAIGQGAQAKLGQEADRLVQPESSDQFHDRGVLPDLKRAIDIFDTLILGIELPEAIVAAINRKIEQLYIAQEYVFRVERERRESERKQIEAVGIRDFQQIVSEGISDSYLRWRGIEATLQLAQSSNAKIVIIGSSKDGLPIILGNVDTPIPARAGASPTPAEVSTTPNNTRTSHPAMLPEKAPAAGLATPSDDQRTRNSAPPSATTPEQPQSFLPLNLSDVEAMLSRFPWTAHPTGSEIGSPLKQPHESPPAERQQ
jgi:regulator of protease activity HflC (stomatin/prohibitin superfamily)